jgi:hypothetical protein
MAFRVGGVMRMAKGIIGPFARMVGDAAGKWVVCTVDFLIMHTVKLYISHIVLELVAPTVGQ